MVTETKEQTIETEESEVAEPETKDGGLDKKTSEGKESVSEKETEEVGKWESPTFNTEEEYDTHLTKEASRIAQGMKDKELKPVYDQLQQLKKDNKTLQNKVADKQELDTLTRLQGKQKEDWGDTPEVGEFQEEVTKTIKLRQQLRDRENELNERLAITEAADHKVTALQKAIAFFLPEDKGFISQIEELTEELSKATSDREIDLILQLREARVKASAESPEKPKRTKPDSSIHSAPGGIDVSKLSPDAKIQLGLDKLRKKQGG